MAYKTAADIDECMAGAHGNGKSPAWIPGFRRAVFKYVVPQGDHLGRLAIDHPGYSGQAPTNLCLPRPAC